jgi:hypothetical protein
MRNSTKTSLWLIVIGLWATTAMAEEKAKADNSKVLYEKNTKLDFEEAVVDGQFQSPDAQLVDGDKNIAFDSLLEAKKDFKKELKRSSGAIR